MDKIVKWGFGMAPLKSSIAEQNKKAIIIVKDFIIGTGSINLRILPDEISWVKGMFNRIIKQDQWDWFTVNMYFDYPLYQDIKAIVNSLRILRNAILKKDDLLGRESLEQLKQSHFIMYCDNYLNYKYSDEKDKNYLYILSRREEPDILKIGMTTRNVQKRVNEINSATGVLYPLSARRVFKVKNCQMVEKEVHDLLAQYRIRADREFFKIEYSKACSLIEDYLKNTSQFYYDAN